MENHRFSDQNSQLQIWKISDFPKPQHATLGKISDFPLSGKLEIGKITDFPHFKPSSKARDRENLRFSLISCLE